MSNEISLKSSIQFKTLKGWPFVPNFTCSTVTIPAMKRSAAVNAEQLPWPIRLVPSKIARLPLVQLKQHKTLGLIITKSLQGVGWGVGEGGVWPFMEKYQTLK